MRRPSAVNRRIRNQRNGNTGRRASHSSRERFYCSANLSSCRSRANARTQSIRTAPDASPHAPGDLVVREPLDVAQEDDLGIIGGEPGERIGQAQLELVAAGSLAGGRAGGRERIAQPTRRLGECLLQRDLTADIAPLGAAKAAHLVQQDVSQDLPQPGRQLGLGAAAKLRPVAHGLEHRLLHDVRRVELRPEPRLDLKPGQQAQPASIALECRGYDAIKTGIRCWVQSSSCELENVHGGACGPATTRTGQRPAQRGPPASVRRRHTLPK